MSSDRLEMRLGEGRRHRLLNKARRGMVALGLIVPSVVFLGLPRNVVDPAALGFATQPAAYSIAYGSLNNFDCVNDTGVEAHGFEIELDDIRCTDLSYTYDYNHYGVPKITEDLSDPAHPKVFVRYASAKLPDGTWAAYTAIPAGPISPTDGHQFTNPAINFGGEHFGVGFNANPTAVKYNWLIDDGSGNLVHGPPVQVATPTFTYFPPAGGAPANVVAAIQPPPPPAPPVFRFGDPSWVKAIKTTTHNANKVRLQELVADDPGKPDPWANGEPDEVETEWKLLQTEFGAAGGGANGELEGAPEEMPDGDEVITRRYEFFKYIGPIDAESGEAVASEVGPDGLHGVGTVTYNHHFDPITGEWVTETVDLSTIVVVGEFFGAQMSGFDVAQILGLIDNLQDGELNVPYPERRVVIGGNTPFVAQITSGSLPAGMVFDPLSGVLSGAPTAVGAFTFTVEASDLSGRVVAHAYTLTVNSGANEGVYNITTASSPLAGGSTVGGGSYHFGDEVTVVATPNPGYYFEYWTEGDVHFSHVPLYTFIATASRDLVASFLPDGEAPTTTSALAGTVGLNDWYVSPVEVSLTATDALSGVDLSYYRLDGGAATVYTGPFMVGTDGTHTVQYWSVDKAQNVEATKSVTFKVDATPPDVAVAANPPALKPANNRIIGVRISGTIGDALAGMDLASGSYATVDTYGLIEPSGTFTIAADGSYSFTVALESRLIRKKPFMREYAVTVQARDLAGNLGTATVVVPVYVKK